MNNFSDQIILVTGGTGSFGRKFIEVALQKYRPKTIRIFSRGELMQQKMRQKFNNSKRDPGWQPAISYWTIASLCDHLLAKGHKIKVK